MTQESISNQAGSSSITVPVETATPAPVQQIDASQPAAIPPPIEPAETVVEAKEDPQFTKKFNALSRKEQQVRQREQQFKQSQTEYAQYKAAIENAKKDPLAALRANGLSLEDVIAYAIGEEDKPVEPEDLTLKSIKEIQDKIADYENAAQEHQNKLKADKKAADLENIQTGIKSFIETNSDKYELIRLHQVESQVWDIIEKTFIQSDGKTTLSEEQAAQLLEDQLEVETKEEIARVEKAKQLKKFQPAKVESSKEPTISYQVSNQESVSKPVSPTLTNNSVSVGVSEPKSKYLSNEESLKEAAKLIKWT